MAGDKILLTEIYPLVEKTFSSKKNIDILEQTIGKYIDRNNESLSSIGPTKLILFLDKDVQPIYDMIGISEEEVKRIKNKSKDIKADGYTMKYPFNSLMPMIIRYFSSTNNTKMVNMCISYQAMSIYPLLFKKYFKFEPDENIMNYTINDLSNKYKIKKTGNLFVAICETAYGSYELHKKDLARGYDKDIVDFVLSMRTRLNSFLKKISIEFYKNVKDEKYLNLEFESNDDDNFREAESSSQIVDRVVSKISMDLLVNGPSIKIITIAAKYNQVSVNELKNHINSIVISNNKDDIFKMIECILLIFILNDKNKPEEINSDKFLLYCLDIYKRSNTTDANIIKIKEILDSWLKDMGVFAKFNRVATINNFRKALYTFFVLSIMSSNTK